MIIDDTLPSAEYKWHMLRTVSWYKLSKRLHKLIIRYEYVYVNVYVCENVIYCTWKKKKIK